MLARRKVPMWRIRLHIFITDWTQAQLLRLKTLGADFFHGWSTTCDWSCPNECDERESFQQRKQVKPDALDVIMDKSGGPKYKENSKIELTRE
ncbi:hypothetical protein MPTK1_2g00020 [Marchantia polymorpha subsp. ruderalis]|uniref:Uncharacterized protein n=1 Tax=Marchantia polymorpha TaxID=3197 RepID=A0A2R6VYT2_MARPO|nr:hypothetical protein MARPO_0436s0001 [Marchantia polymorpha]BBN00532.1 hypothetical protein Mp_2g00020 [Marchantia polymorpha subsp. ruderalis]|eukprot:PTQ26763.1 hypothetical protein MARPO_0436s0001 [Marchantia polymorpha]